MMSCMICVQYHKGNMTTKEARRALTEVVPSDSDEVMHKLLLEYELSVDDMESDDE